MEEIVNRVAQSSIVTIDLEKLIDQNERILYDLKNNLFQEIILKEKDFREFTKEHNWENYKGKHVAIYCSADAIIPKWAYMLVASKLAPFANTVVFGDLQTLECALYTSAIRELNPEDYRDKKVVIKGCGEKEVPESAYVEIMLHLLPVAASLMYGEPCSTVPLYKRPK